MDVKKLIAALGLSVLFIGILVGLHWLPRHSNRHHLRVFVWSNYFSDAVLEQFTAQTGIPVELSFFTSDEELYAKLRAGASGYDIIQPSDYMVQHFRKAGMLAPLQHGLLPHLKNLGRRWRVAAYDKNLAYSVPFTYGITGIAYDSVVWQRLMGSPPPRSWSVLLAPPSPLSDDAKPALALLDNAREVLGAALLWKGKSPNALSQENLKLAQDIVRQAKPHILLFNSEPKQLLLKEEITVAHIYSSDAAQAMAQNPHIRFFVPQEGAIEWVDSFAIPATSSHVTEAHRWIDFFLQPEHVGPLATANHLQSPVLKSGEKIGLTGLLEGTPLYYLLDDPETLELVNQLWTEIKTY